MSVTPTLRTVAVTLLALLTTPALLAHPELRYRSSSMSGLSISTLQSQASQNDTEAQCELGIREYLGEGTHKDKHAGLDLLQQCAKTGNARCMMVLGDLAKKAYEKSNWYYAAKNSPDARFRVEATIAYETPSTPRVASFLEGLNSVLGAANDSMAAANGGTGTIQDATNQQLSNIQAVADRNAAARAQQTTPAPAPYQATLAPPSTAPPATVQALAPAASPTASGRPVDVAYQPALLVPLATPGTASAQNQSKSDDCTSLSSLVAYHVSMPVGPGRCKGEVTVSFTNQTGNTNIDCAMRFRKNGTWAEESSVTLHPGQTIAGQGGGLWTCNADSSDIRYACFATNSTDSQGRECVHHVAF